MNKDRSQHTTRKRHPERVLLFPAAVLGGYGILFAIIPDKAFSALINSGHVLLHIIVPLIVVFIFMILMNLFLQPVHITRFLGTGTGIKGIVLSAVSGIVLTGPIYVWYPLLKEVREKGARNFPIVIFLNTRAVKPFLLPIMISYFGWVYVFILTACTIFGSLLAGYATEALVGEKNRRLN